jgi:hypothetical protein
MERRATGRHSIGSYDGTKETLRVDRHDQDFSITINW